MRSTARSCLFCILLLGFAQAFGRSASKSLDRQLSLQATIILKQSTRERKFLAAEKLLRLVDEKDVSQVSDRTLRKIASLLEINDDNVAMFVSAVLGDFGKRAQFSAPKLIQILSVSECKRWDLSSAATIPVALKRMGVAVPAIECKH